MCLESRRACSYNEYLYVCVCIVYVCVCVEYTNTKRNVYYIWTRHKSILRDNSFVCVHYKLLIKYQPFMYNLNVYVCVCVCNEHPPTILYKICYFECMCGCVNELYKERIRIKCLDAQK